MLHVAAINNSEQIWTDEGPAGFHQANCFWYCICIFSTIVSLSHNHGVTGDHFFRNGRRHKSGRRDGPGQPGPGFSALWRFSAPPVGTGRLISTIVPTAMHDRRRKTVQHFVLQSYPHLAAVNQQFCTFNAWCCPDSVGQVLEGHTHNLC